jgi:hypothetical protein
MIGPKDFGGQTWHNFAEEGLHILRLNAAEYRRVRLAYELPDIAGNLFRQLYLQLPSHRILPKKVEGLVLTGRCISCEQAPFQSARSMAPAMAIGHASGCAAAMAARGDVPPRKLDVKALQNLLLSQNAELRMDKWAT